MFWKRVKNKKKKDRRKRVATLRWLKYPEAFFPTKRKERRTRLVVGHFSLCRKIDELCPYNGNKRVEQRGIRGWMLGFESGKQQAGLGNGKEHKECSGGVYTRIEACIRSLEGCLASWTKVCYRMDGVR